MYKILLKYRNLVLHQQAFIVLVTKTVTSMAKVKFESLLYQ